MKPIKTDSIISSEASLLEVAQQLLLVPFLFVLSGRKLNALVAAADVGSEAGRSMASLNIAAVEIGICKFLQTRYENADGALLLLSLHRQEEEHLKLVQRLREEDRFIDHFAVCSLEDPLIMVGKQESFRIAIKRLGGGSGPKNDLPDFRNDVIHASRPIIREERSRASFIRKMEYLQAINLALEECLK